MDRELDASAGRPVRGRQRLEERVAVEDDCLKREEKPLRGRTKAAINLRTPNWRSRRQGAAQITRKPTSYTPCSAR